MSQVSQSRIKDHAATLLTTTHFDGLVENLSAETKSIADVFPKITFHWEHSQERDTLGRLVLLLLPNVTKTSPRGCPVQVTTEFYVSVSAMDDVGVVTVGLGTPRNGLRYSTVRKFTCMDMAARWITAFCIVELRHMSKTLKG